MHDNALGNYKELIVWQRAMQLCRATYEATEACPESERFGLVSQMRRAAVSIPSNIAEGQGRLGRNEFRQFLGIARGSLRELETQLLLGRDLGTMDDGAVSKCLALADEVGRMLTTLIGTLHTRNA